MDDITGVWLVNQGTVGLTSQHDWVRVTGTGSGAAATDGGGAADALDAATRSAAGHPPRRGRTDGALPLSRRGRLDEVGQLGHARPSGRGYEEALAFANTPEQTIGVLAGLKGYYRFRGQLDEAIRTADAWLDEASMVLAPTEIAQDRFPDIDLYLAAGRVRDAGLLLDRLQAEQPPWATFLPRATGSISRSRRRRRTAPRRAPRTPPPSRRSRHTALKRSAPA